MNILQFGIAIIIFTLLFAGNQALANSVYENEETFAQDDETIPSLTDYRLPKTIIPTNYQIMLIPELEGDFKFTGTVHIKVYVRNATDVITLHHGRITIQKVTVTSITSLDEQQQILSTKYDEKTEKYEIRLKEKLVQGTSFSINIYYSGKLRDDMIGFYRSSYFDSNGKIRWLASTQFQTTHARHAFPCFDEPSFKATFIVRILRKKEYSCLSNMPLKGTNTTAEGKQWDEFEESIPMSTYLVAFIVSDFNSLGGKNDFKVWARPNALNQTNYALDVGPQALDQLSKWFNQGYQISKMDMVAVPDFSAGAMENWGLVTYRESRLLYDEKTTSDAAKQSIASVIVHELTHMWFGNMITPEWWSYLWLSEAFARYFQYFGTALIEKSWNMEDQFLIEQHQTAMAADGIETSQPMTRDVSNWAQMGGIGDTITYNKGASVVRMMSLIFGQDIFQTGLRNYLQNNKDKKVARPENLWLELQNEINRNNKQLAAPVADIMSTWTIQAGFPVVKVSINNGVATMRQSRFLLRNLKSTPTNVIWWIPITWTNDANKNFTVNTTHWLSKEVDRINIESSSDWVIFNVQASGFYRVTYDNVSWYKIINTLNSNNFEDIHVLNRAALVDDLLNLARANLTNYETALDGLKYIQKEKDYLPFKSAFNALTYIDQRFSGHPESYDLLKEFVLELINNRYNELGYFDKPTDDRLTVLLRSEINKWACNCGHEGCINTFTELFKQWRLMAGEIKPNQQAVAYCMGMRYGTSDDWEFLWNQYKYTNSAAEQATILQALGCTRNASNWERYLQYSLEGFERSKIRRQDNSAVFSAVHSTGTSGAEFVLDFVVRNYDKMKAYYDGTAAIASILSSASQRFSTKQLVDKFEKLITTHTTVFQDILDSLRNSLELAKYELAWFNNFNHTIVSWITRFINEQNDSENYYLPNNILPEAYHISLHPLINKAHNFTFYGSVNINAHVVKETKSITLHSAELDYQNVIVFKGNSEIKIINRTIDEKLDFLIIELEQSLMIHDNITIEMEYTGYLNEEMRGFYRSSYRDRFKQTRWLAATHLEPTAARKVFPCFDEPALKATFVIKVTVREDYSAISNMAVKSIKRHINGEKTITFYETPRMSTYLVALVVSDFMSVSMSGPYGVWARSNAIDETKLALSVMDPLLTFYETSLVHSYQLPKLDMVALPDFASGAMENWGLLTYKERNLLYHVGHSTTAQEQSITNVIAHEIAHQWFGNVVSPKWWKYLWLNEGFARYFQYFATNTIKPDWSLELQFIVDQLHSAFEADSSISSHPMTHDVYSPTQIRAIFDSISYAKGASVIRMLEKSVGSSVFYQALYGYLKQRSYDVATPEDLFDAFKEQIQDSETKNSIHRIMNTWTTQAGYPIVYVSIKNNTMHLRQERFLMNHKANAPIKSTWYIPITWDTLNGTNFTDTTPMYWLKDAEASIEIPKSDKGFLILNTQQAGFYRTNYDNSTWYEIIHFLDTPKFTEIHEINRAALIDDLMNLGRAGYVDYATVLSALQYFTREISYGPWRAFFNGMNHLRRHVQGTDAYDAYKRYLTRPLSLIYSLYGYKDSLLDFHITKLFKSHIRKWACELDISSCKLQAIAYLLPNNTILESAKNVPPNERSTSFCTTVELSPRPYWEDLWSLYESSDVSIEKATILQSLACTRDKLLLNQFLGYAVTKESGIRYEDSTSVFTSVITAHLEGAEAVMDFITNNYDTMRHYYGGVSQIKSIVSALGKRLSTDELYTKYMNLIDWLQEKDSSLRSSLKSYKSAAEEELSWADEYIPKIHEWIEMNFPDRNYRLPLLFSPVKYDVKISPYFEEGGFTFNGSVQIRMKRLQGRLSRIVLNAHNLTIKGVTVHSSNSNLEAVEKLEVSNYVQNKYTQTLSIFMKNFITSEYVIVDIEYTGNLNDRLEGFYRSYYLDAQKNIRWLATTQFQPIHARSTFPCFDEPAFKAKFTISIERPNDYIALSNMPRAYSVPSSISGRTWDTFEESVEMSTYLIAFIVCDFQAVHNAQGKVNVWGRPDIVEHGELAGIAAIRMLEYLSAETGYNYTLPKLDLIGIPDFAMGAMENWGLATFREYGLFYKENVTSAEYTDYILTIIAHELAHMWYGNLVTCRWWDYIWLNEGFAEYMQWRIADEFRPSYGFDDLFVVDELQIAMQNDDYSSTHAMNNPVAAPSEIAKIFDTVTYGKSASVIRMIHNSLEPKIFPKAMNKYLSQNQYKTTTPKELWKAFDETIKEGSGSNISLEVLMDTWINEPGYPVVIVTKINDYMVTLKQKFSFGEPFWIPITYTTSVLPDFNTTSATHWIREGPLQILINSTCKWFIVNIRQSGYYRVNYDLTLWLDLITALNSRHSEIHVTNRAQIIDDLLNLARKGQVDYKVAIEGTTYLLNEGSYLPWKAFFNAMDFLEQHLNSFTLREYILYLTSVQYKRLGFVDTVVKHQDKLMGGLILSWVCKYDEMQCVEKSKTSFALWRDNQTNEIPPDARPAVYCTALRHGSEDDWSFLWQRYLETNFVSEKKVILNALGCTNDTTLLNQYIKKAFTQNYTADIRKQDVSAAVASVYSNRDVGLDVMMDFLFDHYEVVYQYYKDWNSVAELFLKVTSRISTSEQLAKFEIFLNTKGTAEDLQSIRYQLQSGFEKALSQYLWCQSHCPEIEEFLSYYTPSPSGGIAVHSLSMTVLIIISIVVYTVSWI